MGSKSRLSVPERRKVVLSLLRREEPATVLARRYGISENTLYRWRDEFVVAGEVALANGKGKAEPRDRQIAELKKQLGERDKVIGELTIANRIQKKRRTSRTNRAVSRGTQADGQSGFNCANHECVGCVEHRSFELVSQVGTFVRAQASGSSASTTNGFSTTRRSATHTTST